jgi:hypothetical protein
MKLSTYFKQHPHRPGAEKALPGVQRGLPNNHETGEWPDSNAWMLSFGGLVHFLLGVSLFIPGFSLITVGNHTGVQSALILIGICGILRVSQGRLRRDLPVLGLLITWAISLIITVLIGGWKPINVHPMVSLDVCLFVIGIFSLTCDMPESYDLGLQKGLLAGAVLSALYALYQQAALRFGLPFGVPPLNNPSFYEITDTANWGLRSFAFFSEPSILAAYLIPMAVATLYSAATLHAAKSTWWWLISLLIFVGLVTTGSVYIFVSLPVALFLCLFAQRRRLDAWIKVSVALLSFALLVLLLIVSFGWAASLSDVLVSRVSNAKYDESLISRYGMDIASLRIFEENPIFGYGVNPDPDYFFERMPPETTIYQSADSLVGGDSLLLVILSGQGICGFFCFAALIFVGVRRSSGNVFLQSALIGCVVVMTIQCSNIDLYLIWVVMGLCLARPANGRAAVAHAAQT